MACDDIKKALAEFSACEETPEGSRIATHCLYPSYEHVRVFVAKVGDGYRIHDGAGAFNAAWLHGRESEMIARSLKDASERFQIIVAGNALIANVGSIDWLTSGILSVANASAMAAHDAVDRIVAAQEVVLVDRIGRTLNELMPNHVSKNVDVKGISGGTRHFDFVVMRESPRPLYINSVTPRKNSIAAKYVSFADNAADNEHKFAVHDRELEQGDAALLQKVSSVVPLLALRAGAERSFANDRLRPIH